MDARELFHGLSPNAIADRFNVSRSTARRWKKTGRLPRLAHCFAELILAGELGHFGPAWQGWKVLTKNILSPEGFSVTAGEIRAIPVRLAQVAELERERCAPHQWRLI